MDIKKILSIVDGPGKQSLTESKNMAKDMVMQHYSTPTVNAVTKYRSNINEYFKAVDTEMQSVLEESKEQKKVAVKNIVNRVLTRLDESKTEKDSPKPRNFVAKNAKMGGAGQHKDKKKAEKQGDVKHKQKQFAEGVAEGRFGGDAYARDYASSIDGMDGSDKRDFKRREMEHELGHETNNYAVAINGKTWKVFGTRSHAEAVANKIQMRDPAKKVSVHETGAPVSEQLAESYGSVEVGSPVKVYSNVLKKTVFGKVVKLQEGRAYVQYNNTKIVMGHPINEVAAVAAPAASMGGKLASRLVPGLGLAVSGYDAYDRAKKGDYTGAALSGAAGLASLIPGVGTAASIGLTGAQLARDYKKKTGAFAPDEAEPGQAATPAPAGKGTIPNPTKYPTTDAEIRAFQQAKGLAIDGKIGPKTQAALDAAGIKKPAQAATPAPTGSNVAAAARTVAPAASAIAQRALK